jgi:hypothetical protein
MPKKLEEIKQKYVREFYYEPTQRTRWAFNLLDEAYLAGKSSTIAEIRAEIAQYAGIDSQQTLALLDLLKGIEK